jgi:pimeloyl-ACP methyl ester carboxylesterase
MNRILSRGFAGGLLLAFAMAATPVRSPPLWETLPPTPELPKGAVEIVATIDGARIWSAQWGTAAPGAVMKMWYSLPAYTADQLRSIAVPTTIADGEYDEAIRPEHVRYMAATIPHARLVIMPGVSHFAMLQDPKVFGAAVLEFLRRD